MRRLRWRGLAGACLAVLTVVPGAAQSAVLVGNFGQDFEYVKDVSHTNSVVASFRTGLASTLTSIEFKQFSRSYNGVASPPAALHTGTVSGGLFTLGAKVADLVNPATTLGTTVQTITYNAPSGTSLAAATTYYVVLGPTTPAGKTALVRRGPPATDSGGSPGWSLPGISEFQVSGTGSAGPFAWDATQAIQIRVNGTTESAGVLVSRSKLEVPEGDASGAEYTLRLASAPSASVTVTVSGHSGTDLTVTPATLTFTTTNWQTEQTVTVTAAEDTDGDDDTVTLTHAVSGYGTVTTASSVEVTVDDDEGVSFDPDASYEHNIPYGPATRGTTPWTLDLADFLLGSTTGVTLAVVSCDADFRDYFASDASITGTTLALTTNSLGRTHERGSPTTCTISATPAGSTLARTREFRFDILPSFTPPRPNSLTKVGTPATAFRIDSGVGSTWVRLAIRSSAG